MPNNFNVRPLYLQIKDTLLAQIKSELYLRAADTNRKCSCGYLFLSAELPSGKH